MIEKFHTFRISFKIRPPFQSSSYFSHLKRSSYFLIIELFGLTGSQYLIVFSHFNRSSYCFIQFVCIS